MPFKDDWGRNCGFLCIDEEDKKKKFEKRFFLLNKLHGHLEWYTGNPLKENEVVELCGIINLDYITNVDEARKLKPNYCFVINTIHQSHYVQASSQKEMEDWVQIINDASKIIVPREALIYRSSSEVHFQNDHDNFEVDDISGTRTEIVGNVVVRKMLSDCQKPLDDVHRRRHNSTELIRSSTDARDHASQATFENGIREKDVIKKGWIAKQNRSRKTFKPRFVVLTKDGFAYYKSERMVRHPLHYVSINEMFGAKAEDENTTYLYDNLVIVITIQKVFYFQANNRREMHEWVDAFNKTVREYKTCGGSNQFLKRGAPTIGGSIEDLDEIRASPPLSKQRVRKQFSMPYSGQRSPRGGVFRKYASVDEERESCEKNILPRSSQLYDDDKAPTTRNRVRSIEEARNKVTAQLQRAETVAVCAAVPSNNKALTKKMSTENFVATRLDPQVDNRSAIKPSLVKKKKTLGILFAFNAMLSKKREKIQKETAKYKKEHPKP